MLKFSPFTIKKLYFKLIVNSISGNCDPLFSQINFDHTHYFFGGRDCPGGMARGIFVQGFYPERLCPGTTTGQGIYFGIQLQDRVYNSN